MTQVLKGTWQELAIHAAALGDTQLTLVIPGDEETVHVPRSTRPEVVSSTRRLEELLLEGLASPGSEMNDADWAALIKKAEARPKGTNG